MLEKIKECLKTDDFKKIRKLIGNERSYPKFNAILKVIYDFYSKQEYPDVDEIGEFLKYYFGECDLDLVVLRLCSFVYFDIRIIKWLVKIFDVTYYQTMYALFQEWRESNVEQLFRGPLGDPLPGPFPIASSRLLKATAENRKDIDWVSLRHEAYELGNYLPEGVEYFSEMITKYGDFAPIPSWCVIDAYPECEFSEDILSSKNFEIKLDSILETTREEKKEQLTVLYNNVLRFEPYPEGTPERDIDMINGLPNPQLDEECVSFKGKCRMFTCRCHTGHKMEDWFHGKCDFCSSPIRKSQHAIRYPLPEGGFSGCFCSFEHLMGHLLTLEINELIQKHAAEGLEQPQQFKTKGLYNEEEETRLLLFLNILKQVKVKVHPELL